MSSSKAVDIQIDQNFIFDVICKIVSNNAENNYKL